MGRLFSILLFAAMLMHVPVRTHAVPAQPVFFSMLFPQLVPGCMREATVGEAVRL